MPRRSDASEPAVEDAPVSEAGGKGRATPTRREREAANHRPLIPSDRKEAARQARARTTQSRERARVGLAAGEERYLPAKDRGPQRRFVRDYVDARFSAGEVVIPLTVLFLFFSLTPIPAVTQWGIIVLWVLLGIAALDCVVLGFTVTRRVGAKFGEGNVERGLKWYAAMRALQFRRLRLPKPQVKRGQWPS